MLVLLSQSDSNRKVFFAADGADMRKEFKTLF